MTRERREARSIVAITKTPDGRIAARQKEVQAGQPPCPRARGETYVGVVNRLVPARAGAAGISKRAT